MRHIESIKHRSAGHRCDGGELAECIRDVRGERLALRMRVLAWARVTFKPVRGSLEKSFANEAMACVKDGEAVQERRN